MIENENPTQELTLTEQEKHQLENYKGDNQFIKSLAEKFCEYGKLTDRQINALRNQETRKENLERCPNTDLHLKQTAVFLEDNQPSNVVVNAIRPKAICLFDENNNRFAWMPSKAVKVENQINSEYSQDGTDVDVLTLKSWFKTDKEFWKVSKPIGEKKVEKTEEIEENPPAQQKVEFEKAVDNLYSEPETDIDTNRTNEADELPF